MIKELHDSYGAWLFHNLLGKQVFKEVTCSMTVEVIYIYKVY